MDCVRSHIKIGLDLLSDEDPDNDWQGYLRLAVALMHAGKDTDSLAAWSMIGPNDFRQAEDLDGVDDGDETMPGIPQAEKHDDSIGLKEPEANGQPSSDPLQDQTVPKLPRTKTQSTSVGPMEYQCDGDDCSHTWTYSDNIHVCKDCLDVMFADPCLEALRKDALEDKICGPGHEFLHVPPWDPVEAQHRGPTKLRQGEVTIPVSQWLQKLREEWGLVDTE
jgi:hypothetical protein